MEMFNYMILWSIKWTHSVKQLLAAYTCGAWLMAALGLLCCDLEERFSSHLHDLFHFVGGK